MQRLLSRSPDRRIARARDTRLATLLSRHESDAATFTRDVLGALLDAPEEVVETVRVHLAEMGSITRTAARLHTHRNTVMRRLERAEALLPAP